jgi:hypothetical protein
MSKIVVVILIQHSYKLVDLIVNNVWKKTRCRENDTNDTRYKFSVSIKLFKTI